MEVIVPNLQIPLIQGTLLYATKTDKLSAGTCNGELGASHAFSRSILPLLDSVSTTSADVIDSAMQFQLDTKPVPDGPSQVFGALADALPGMEPNCSDILTCHIHYQPNHELPQRSIVPHRNPLGEATATATTSGRKWEEEPEEMEKPQEDQERGWPQTKVLVDMGLPVLPSP